jgi:hypothetical protein
VGETHWSGSITITVNDEKVTMSSGMSNGVTGTTMTTIKYGAMASLTLEGDDTGSLKVKSGMQSGTWSVMTHSTSSGMDVKGCPFMSTYDRNEMLTGDAAVPAGRIVGALSTYDGMYSVSASTPGFEMTGTETVTMTVSSSISGCDKPDSVSTRMDTMQGGNLTMSAKGAYDPATPMIKGTNSKTETFPANGETVTTTYDWQFSLQ